MASIKNEEEWIQQLVDSITSWWKVIDQEDLSKDVIIIVGITGSGKTTIANILGGQLNILKACKVQRRIVILDDNNRIGEPSPISKTSVPMFYHCKYKNKIVVIVDAPGFGDNRGPLVDIVAMTLVKRVTEKCARIKFLFVIPYSAVNSEFDRTHFPSLVEHSAKLIGNNFKNIQNSVGFVINMVHNYSPLSFNEEITDDDVKTEIEEYLTKCKGAFEPDYPRKNNEMEIQKEFVDLLQNSLSTKVCLLRYPKKAGNLDEDDYFQWAREKILEFCEEKLEGAIGNQFGYAFSPASLLEIGTKLIPHLTTKTEFWVGEIVQDLKSSYNPEPILASSRDRILKVQEQLLLLKALRVAFEPDAGNKPSMLLRTIANIVELPPIDEEKFSNLTTREEQLKYFLELSEAKFPPGLFQHVKRLQETFVKRLGISVMKPLFDSIKEQIYKSVWTRALASFIEKQLHSSTSTHSFNTIIDILHVTVSGMEKCLEEKDTRVEITLEKALKIMKYYPAAIPYEIEELKQLTKRWKDFKVIWQPQEQAMMNEKEWLQPVKQTLLKVRNLTAFYELVAPLETKILEYKSCLELISLSEQQWKDGQNIFFLLEKKGIFGNSQVAPEIKEMYKEDSHCKQVFERLLKLRPPTILATSEGITFVEGRCVNIRQFVNPDGKLGELLEHKKYKLTTLLVFASEKIFLDSGIFHEGEEFTIIFMAPQFEVIGTDREILLVGHNAPSHKRDCGADGERINGSLAGKNGLPGLPGFNGGSFMGIFNTVINGKALTIKTKGGDGGAGQNGENGKPGMGGSHANEKSFPSPSQFKKYLENRPLMQSGEFDLIDEMEDDNSCCDCDCCFPFFTKNKKPSCVISGKPGEAGGNGGKGGAGGAPGNPGLINIICTDGCSSDNEIKEVKEKGSEGPPGKGGKGGEGGENGFSLKRDIESCLCFTHWGKIIKLRDWQYAQNGEDGKDGANSAEKQVPKKITMKQTWYRYVKNEYDQFLSEEPSFSENKLMESFKNEVFQRGHGDLVQL
ncbi:unnamed protein product [Orchesella dallaii]|uniref:AAA+ ATPase domain-containing protein n=1 Tax=Orchesella dallaii TaxID=48710 RepID=A0ABP1PSQ5_9HEXA